MTTTKVPSKVWSDAATRIRDGGWWSGTDQTTSTHLIPSKAECLATALWHSTPHYEETPLIAEIRAALGLSSDYRPGYGWTDIYNWNDTPGRTVEQVLEILDKLAAVNPRAEEHHAV